MKTDCNNNNNNNNNNHNIKKKKKTKKNNDTDACLSPPRIVQQNEGLQRATSQLRGSTLTGPLAEVMNFVRLGKKVRPGTLGKIKVG